MKNLGKNLVLGLVISGCFAQVALSQNNVFMLQNPQTLQTLSLEAKLSQKLTPAGHNWINSMARSFLNGQIDEAAIRAQGAANLGVYISEGDIEQLVYLVMAQAAKGASADMKDQMQQVNAQNKSKANMRGQVSAMKGKIDSMSEMNEMQSMRLQMAMQRKSQMESTLSNILKKQEETSSAIVNNIK